MPKLDVHKRRLEGVRRAYGRGMYDANSGILKDKSLDPLTRSVLGITGSEDELRRYRDMADSIGRLAGEKVLLVDVVNENCSGKRRLSEAVGGIISGCLEVGLVDDIDVVQDTGVRLKVPVDGLVSARWDSGGRCMDNPYALGSITVAHLVPSITTHNGRDQLWHGWEDEVHAELFIGDSAVGVAGRHYKDTGLSIMIERLVAAQA